jgi:pyridoxal phosphate enzyme (YggS family)
MPPRADIARNLDTVRRRLNAAAHRAHRSPEDIQLVAVSKNFPASDIEAAAAAGQRAFGENRVQEGLEKIAALAGLDLSWHLIGHLQSNKARKAAGFDWIESIDSLDLLQRVDRAATEAGHRPRVLIQVDLAREATKYGADQATIRPLVDAALAAESVRLEGLMVIPPYAEDADASRPWFRQLRGLRDQLVADGVHRERLAHLSMGMSHDFEVAIEEGATIVRVGSAIFGERVYAAPSPP